MTSPAAPGAQGGGAHKFLNRFWKVPEQQGRRERGPRRILQDLWLQCYVRGITGCLACTRNLSVSWPLLSCVQTQ